MKPHYGKLEKLRLKSFLPVEGHQLLVPDLRLHPPLRQLIKRKKLGT